MAHSVERKLSDYDVLMFSFSGVDTARKVLATMKADHEMDGVEIAASAVVTHDAAGHVHLHERGSAAVGATAGAVTAGVIGLVAGPLGLLVMLVAGGVVGGVAGHFAGQILPHDDLQRVGEALPPDSSAFLALVCEDQADALCAAFAEHGAEVVKIPVETELASAISEAITHGVSRVDDPAGR